MSSAEGPMSATRSTNNTVHGSDTQWQLIYPHYNSDVRSVYSRKFYLYVRTHVLSYFLRSCRDKPLVTIIHVAN